MVGLKLTQFETELALAAADARICDFSGRPRPVKIRAEAIQRLLLGLPVRLARRVAEASISIPGPGVRLKGAAVMGPLMLDDARAITGDACPPLALEECIVAEPIRLAGAHLRRLSLRGSQITHLHAPNVRLDATLDLSKLISAETAQLRSGVQGRGICWVNLDASTIAGSVEAGGAFFVAPRLAALAAGSGLPSHALQLRDSDVRDSVLLASDAGTVHAIGGIDLSGSEIGGDVRADGAETVAIEGGAFWARRVHVRGSISLCPSEDRSAELSSTSSFQAKGLVSFHGSKINGNVELVGAQLEGDLIAVNMDVGSDVVLYPYYKDNLIVPFKCIGEVNFHGVKISGNLEMAGAFLNSSFNATNIEIGDDALLRPWAGEEKSLRFTAKGAVIFHGAKIGGNLEMDGAELSKELNAAVAVIGGAVLLRAEAGKIDGKDEGLRFTAGGEVNFQGAAVGGNLELSGALLRDRFTAENANISGAVLLRTRDVTLGRRDKNLPFSVAGEVKLLGATIGRSLNMRGAQLGTGASLHDATINGSLRLHLHDDNSRPVVHLNFRGAKVGALEDGGGLGYGERALLTLEGFQYGRLSHAPDEVSETRPGTLLKSLQQSETGRRISVATFWLSVSFLLYALAEYNYRAAVNPLAVTGIILSVAVWALCETRFDNAASKARIQWLNSQYEGGRITRNNSHEYKPDPYERLSRQLRMEGLYDAARRIASHRLTVERKYRIFFAFRWAVWLYWLCFDYGLSPRRALLTFTLSIGLGAGAVVVADKGLNGAPPYEPVLRLAGLETPTLKPVLVINSAPVSAVAVARHGAELAPETLVARPSETQDELACGDEIEPLLYAIDLFLPAIDLDQESRCSISTKPAAFAWRFAAAVYAILGALISSLTILTISGVLRRQAET